MCTNFLACFCRVPIIIFGQFLHLLLLCNSDQQTIQRIVIIMCLLFTVTNFFFGLKSSRGHCLRETHMLWRNTTHMLHISRAVHSYLVIIQRRRREWSYTGKRHDDEWRGKLLAYSHWPTSQLTIPVRQSHWWLGVGSLFCKGVEWKRRMTADVIQIS